MTMTRCARAVLCALFVLTPAFAAATPVTVTYAGGVGCVDGQAVWCGTPVTGHYTFDNSVAGVAPSGYYVNASGYAYDAITGFSISTDFGLFSGNAGRITTDSASYSIELFAPDGWFARIHQPFQGGALTLPSDSSLMYPPSLGVNNGALYNPSVLVPTPDELCDPELGAPCGPSPLFWPFQVRQIATSAPGAVAAIASARSTAQPVQATSVPEYGGTLAFLGLGLVGLVGLYRSRTT